MTDVLIRGISAEAVAHIDDEAAGVGLSRNEYLRRQLESEPAARRRVQVSDFVRAADACQDLLDPEIMAAAWR